jgi:hypothetical protein
MLVVYPINPGERKRQQINQENRRDDLKACRAVFMRHLQLKNHDGDDDSDHAIGESLQAGGRG